MAYLHCHHCHWSQDDFWDFSFGRYGYPRRIEHDKCCIQDYGWKRFDPHSWWLIWYQFKRILRKFKNQKWWTEKSFRRDHRVLKLAYCPNCGSKTDFDID